MTIAVIIPFYQRTPGLLTRAIRSIALQSHRADVRVVVVDDASPIDTRSEVAAVGDAPFPIDVVAQKNAGPAAARNRGLDSLGPDVHRVAFLDSDDEWESGHLERATRALDAGHDFYFADLFQPGQTVSAFERAGRMALETHVPIDAAAGLYAYRGDMFDQIIRGNLIGTSTVVYDFRRFDAQRFDEAFYSAGEDYLFWIACARAGARFCFSAKVDVRYGYGVNVYAGSGWGTEGHLRRVHNELRYRKRLLGFPLDAGQRALVVGKIGALRNEFAMGLIHRVLGRKEVDGALLRAQLRLDPLTAFAVPAVAGQAAADRIRSRSAP